MFISYDKERLNKTAILIESLGKLFIVPNTLVELKLKVTKEVLEATDKLFVRVVPFFRTQSEASQSVNVCGIHSVTNSGKPMRPNHQHLVLSSESGATYHTDPESQRHNVVIPVFPELSENGSGRLVITLKFTDRPECALGLSSRAIGALFTLETASEILGRTKIRVRLTFQPEKISQFESDEKKRQK